MLLGAHSVIFSTNAEADRAFLRDELGLPGIDAGDGWLIFALPPSELAVHPAEKNNIHEVFLLVDDIEEFVADKKKRGVAFEPVRMESWGFLTYVTIPGGGRLGFYEPRHPRPKTREVGGSPGRPAP